MIQKVKTPYGMARIYGRSAPKAKGLVMIVPGYSESLSHNRETVDILAKNGYDAFTFSQPRRKAVPIDGVLDRQKDIILSIVAAVTPDGERVYAVAHSLGSAALLKAAHSSPEYFLELILMQPPGLSDEQNFSTLVRRASKKTLRNATSTLRDRHLYKLKRQVTSTPVPRSATTRKLLRSQLSSSYVIAKNPVLALREAHAVRRYNIASDIAVSKVPVHIIRAEGDELFNKPTPEHERIMKLQGSLSSIADKNAPHDTFWLHAEQTVELITTFIRHGKV